LFFAAYEDAAREMCNINCGHNPPMLLPKRGCVFRRQRVTYAISVPTAFT
jgi:hypothetical protein